MKKSICFILAAMLLLSAGLTPSYAYGNGKNFTPPGLAKKGGLPPGLAKKGGLPPGIAKKFKDIDGYQWAKDALEKMVKKDVIRGISENEFAPSRNVTKVEALVMIIRTMGWGNEAETNLDLIKKGKKQDKLKDKLQDWGKGYIELALEKGLIDEVDLWQQNFTTPATREDVAKYIIRALERQEEAEKYMEKELRFKDASAVSIGAVGYVYLIDKEKIMSGYPDHTFRPNQPVKRIEMAQLVANLDEKLNDNNDDNNKEDEEFFEGKIKSINSDEKEIVVKIDNKEKLFELTNDTVIKVDGKIAEIKDLDKGMKVEITVEDDEVVKVYAKSIEEDSTENFKGKIESIDSDKKEIVVKIDDKEKLFELTNDTVIKVDGKITALIDLYKGMKVEIVVKDKEVIEVYAESIKNDYTGKIVEKIEGNINKLTIKINGENKTYKVDKDVIIQLENNEDDEVIIEYKNFKDLKLGSNVKIKVENNIIVKIEIK